MVPKVEVVLEQPPAPVETSTLRGPPTPALRRSAAAASAPAQAMAHAPPAAHPAAVPPARPAAEIDCDPPYSLDDQGHKHWKDECFRK